MISDCMSRNKILKFFKIASSLQHSDFKFMQPTQLSTLPRREQSQDELHSDNLNLKQIRRLGRSNHPYPRRKKLHTRGRNAAAQKGGRDRIRQNLRGDKPTVRPTAHHRGGRRSHVPNDPAGRERLSTHRQWRAAKCDRPPSEAHAVRDERKRSTASHPIFFATT